MSDITHLAWLQFFLSQPRLVAEIPHDDQGPAIFPTRREFNPTKLLPQVVIMEMSGSPDRTYTYRQGSQRGGMKHESWSMQVWDNSRDPVRIKKIGRIIEEILIVPRIHLSDTIRLHLLEKVDGGQVEGWEPNLKESFYTQIFHLAYTPLV